MLRIASLLLGACTAAASSAATFHDDMAQRTLACTACHGPQGRAGPDGYYPHLAGKPSGYLYNQLLNFRDGRRHYALMERLLDPLSDEYLLDIARWFASLQVPYPPPAPPKVSKEQLERGRQVVMQGDPAHDVPACVQCHGKALTGVMPTIPGLVGLPRDYLNAQLGAWRSGQRRAHAPDCMAEVARRLTPDDLSAVTGWLSAHPVPASAKPAAGPLSNAPLECGSAILPSKKSGQ
jgi:cytochrome c553